MQYIIIGAGISGLICGLELLKKGAAVSIYEKNQEVGGLVRTKSINGVPVDTGPHLYHTVHNDIIEYWRQFVGSSLVEKPFYAGNYIDGKIFDYPINEESLLSQFNEKQVNVIQSELANCSEEKRSAARTYSEYVDALAGPTLANKFFKAYPEKLWGIPTSKLSARFAPKRIEIREKRRPFHSGGGKFAGVLLDGCGFLPQKIYDEFISNGGKIHFGFNLSAATYNKNSLNELNFDNGKTVTVSDEEVIFTIPIDSFSKLFGLQNDLYFRCCHCINILVQGDDPFPQDYDWLYFPAKSPPFHRAGLQTRFSRKGFADGQHLLCLEIAYTEKPSCDLLKSWERQSIDFLEENDFIEKKDILDIIHWDLGPLYPGYYIGHEAEVAEVKSFADSFGNVSLLGSLAEYSYADLQVLTSKSLDMAETLYQKSIKRLKAHSASIYNSGSIVFGDVNIGVHDDVFTIAEIGLNHNGSVTLCKNLIKKCSDAGFSAVKLQTYSAGRISKKTKSAKYFEETLDAEENISDFVDRIRLSDHDLFEIWEYCRDLKIQVFSTPFDLESLDVLNNLGVPGFKISSMDLVNTPLIDAVSKIGKPVILSTGMASLGEIEEALQICYRNGNRDIILLHCVSSYPCQIEHSNLSRIKRLADAFSVVVGFSDHTAEVETPALAVAAGARVIEKHVTSDKLLDGPDHSFSLEPNEFQRMISLINKANASLVDTSYFSTIERSARQNLRRSVYSSRSISKGTRVTLEDFVIRSPGDGLDPKDIYVVLNKKVRKDIDEDMPVTWDDFLETE